MLHIGIILFACLDILAFHVDILSSDMLALRLPRRVGGMLSFKADRQTTSSIQAGLFFFTGLGTRLNIFFSISVYEYQ